MNNIPDEVGARLRRSLESRGATPELSPELVANAHTRTPPRLVNPARRAQIAGGATFAVAAVAVGSLVFVSSFQQTPLFTAAGDAATAQFEAADAADMSMRIAPWINYEYVAGAALATDRGSGSVYQLERTGSAVDTLADVAAAFSLDGEPTKTEYFDAQYPTYVIGTEDGSAASLVISDYGTGNWWYNDPTAYPPFECAVIEPDRAEPGMDMEIVDPVCSVPEPVAADSLAPSEPDARQQAAALFSATGLDVAASDIRINADTWQTSAIASLTVDGVATAIEWTISWSGATGKVSSASGHSIDVVDRGTFDTVSAVDAVDRLSDGRWFGAAGPDYQGGMHIYAVDSLRGVAEDAPAAPDAPVESPVEPTTPAEPVKPTGPAEPKPSEPQPTEPAAPGEPTPPAPTEPADPGEATPEPEVTQPVEPLPTLEPDVVDPGEPMPLPEPEIVVATVDNAEPTLLLMWDVDGNAWLVPGYAMQHPEGWWNGVVSLVDGVIELPKPIEAVPYSDLR